MLWATAYLDKLGFGEIRLVDRRLSRFGRQTGVWRIGTCMLDSYQTESGFTGQLVVKTNPCIGRPAVRGRTMIRRCEGFRLCLQKLHNGKTEGGISAATEGSVKFLHRKSYSYTRAEDDDAACVAFAKSIFVNSFSPHIPDHYPDLTLRHDGSMDQRPSRERPSRE